MLGSRTSITSPCDQSRSVSANGSARRRRHGVVQSLVHRASGQPSRPRRRRSAAAADQRASWPCRRARPARSAGACRGPPRSSAAAPRSRRAPGCWPPSARAPPGRAGRAALSLICSIGGRISTTAITCEVTSQMTKSTHWLPSAAHPFGVRVALRNAQEARQRHLRQDQVAGQGELQGAEGEPLRRAQDPRRLRRPGGEGVQALGRLLRALRRRRCAAPATRRAAGRSNRAITEMR